MDTRALLRQLQQEAQAFSESDIQNRLTKAKSLRPSASIGTRLAVYNCESLLSLKAMGMPPTLETVSVEKVNALRFAVMQYMEEHAPGDALFVNMVCILSVYLTFIAKLPLHPPGMFHPEGKAEYAQGRVVCPVRRIEIGNTGSLCRFCVSIESPC